MPHLLVLTEAGSIWGAGHLTRCSALAKAFEQLGWSTNFLVQTDPAGCLSLQPSVNIPWHTNRDAWQREVQGADLVLLDSYQASQATIEALASAAANLSVIDDFPHRDYRRGNVIDWSLNAEAYAYPQRHSQVNYFLGCQYACLRPPFWDFTPHRPTSIKRILVIFGSSDIRGLAIPALSAITASFPGTKVEMVIGGPTKGRNLPCPESQVTFHSFLDAAVLRQLMLSCDVAISGGGQTLYELAACGVPTIAIDLIDNQSEDLSHFAAADLIHYAGHWQDHDLWEKVVIAIDDLKQSPEKLTKRSSLGQTLIDGRGAFRLAQRLTIVS